MTRRGAPLQAVQSARTLEVAVDAGEVHQEREGARGAGVAVSVLVICRSNHNPAHSHCRRSG